MRLKPLAVASSIAVLTALGVVHPTVAQATVAPPPVEVKLPIEKCFITGPAVLFCAALGIVIVEANRDRPFGPNGELMKFVQHPFGGEKSAVNVFFHQPLGGDKSAVNAFLHEPLGGKNSAVREVLHKPFGGEKSVVRQIFKRPKL